MAPVAGALRADLHRHRPGAARVRNPGASLDPPDRPANHRDGDRADLVEVRCGCCVRGRRIRDRVVESCRWRRSRPRGNDDRRRCDVDGRIHAVADLESVPARRCCNRGGRCRTFPHPIGCGRSITRGGSCGRGFETGRRRCGCRRRGPGHRRCGSRWRTDGAVNARGRWIWRGKRRSHWRRTERPGVGNRRGCPAGVVRRGEAPITNGDGPS